MVSQSGPYNRAACPAGTPEPDIRTSNPLPEAQPCPETGQPDPQCESGESYYSNRPTQQVKQIAHSLAGVVEDVKRLPGATWVI